MFSTLEITVSGQQYDIDIEAKGWDKLEIYKIKFDDTYTSQAPLNSFHERERLSFDHSITQQLSRFIAEKVE